MNVLRRQIRHEHSFTWIVFAQDWFYFVHHLATQCSWLLVIIIIVEVDKCEVVFWNSLKTIPELCYHTHLRIWTHLLCLHQLENSYIGQFGKICVQILETEDWRLRFCTCCTNLPQSWRFVFEPRLCSYGTQSPVKSNIWFQAFEKKGKSQRVGW